MTTTTEVHDLETRVSVLEEQLRGALREIQHIREENQVINSETRDRLTKVEDVVNDLQINTALTRQALEGIQEIARDLKNEREASHKWRVDQDAKWNKIAGAKWVIGLLFAALLGFSEVGQHVVRALF